MNFNEYQTAAARTAAKIRTPEEGFSVGGMGLSGEASELLELFMERQESFLQSVRVAVTAGKVTDYLKKVVHHGHSVDVQKVKKELGDVLWYLALTAGQAGLTLDEVAEENIAKLRARYPDAFETTRSVNRAENDR